MMLTKWCLQYEAYNMRLTIWGLQYEAYNTSSWIKWKGYLQIYKGSSLVVECSLLVQEVSGSIPHKGPRHTKDVKNGTSSFLV